MKASFHWCLALATLVTPLAGRTAEGQAPSPELHWYRCNTHTHTGAPPQSDANETPELIAEWYRAHGYQCIVITDHEFLTDVAPLNRKLGGEGDFLVLQGQEVTQMIADLSYPDGIRHHHINGINIDQAVMPIGYPQPARGTTPLQAYQRNIAQIRAAGGLPQINHPNLAWSVHLDDIPKSSEPYLFELWNTAPASNNLGGADDKGNRSPSPEGLWDALLSRGDLVWGVASDDAHEYKRFDDHFTSTPGKAWIVLQATSLTTPAVMDALRKGHFYASTGISLESYSADASSISLTISPRAAWTSKRKPNARYATRFIGENGQLLAEVNGPAARYRFKGNERYVRASIIDSDGKRAWTQPVFPDRR